MAGRPKRAQDLQVLAEKPEVGEQIIAMLGEGKQLAKICYETGLSKVAILDWLDETPERAALASRARAKAAHVLAGETLEIADEADADHPGELQKAKLRIQARTWVAERWGRATYGAPSAQANVTINLGSMHLDALRSRTVGTPEEPRGVIDVVPRAATQDELDAL